MLSSCFPFLAAAEVFCGVYYEHRLRWRSEYPESHFVWLSFLALPVSTGLKWHDT